MSVGILGTALSGLAAFQRSLETTSNNIANVNTEGYSRQRAELATRREIYTGNGYVGNGVATANITRGYDQFITNQVRSSTSAFGEVDAYHSLASQIDNIIADESTGLAPAMKSFFDAVHGVANDPTSIPARQSMLSEADLLAQNFNTMGQRFSEIRNQVNQDVTTSLNEINDYAKSIAELNVKIVADIGRASGKQLPNDLMDQRDELVRKIAEQIDVSVVQQQDGSISVFIGQGQSMVLGNYAAELSAQGSSEDPAHMEILMDNQNISQQLSGGKLYGNLRFRDEVLDPAQQRLGLLATGLSIEFNNLQQGGADLYGNVGDPLFDLGIPQIAVSGSNPASTLTADFLTPASAATLEATDYRITVTGPGSYIMTRLNDNTTVADPSTVGLNLTFDGNEVAGDTFLVRPTFHAALSINEQITDPRKIAAASTAAGVPGDNNNALRMANLETGKKLLGGTASFVEGYGQLVSHVGTLTHSAEISRSAQDVLLKQATSARETVAGVNLDEEAANLIKFQNAYQASAKVVSVANSLFDALIGAVR